jgi:radical SAM protein with 4Fe4S-binding SPASM domain
MGLLILKKGKEALDLAKLRWLLQNPLSKAVVNELLEKDESGSFRVEELLDSYPERPPSLSWFSFQAANKVLGALRETLTIPPERFKQALKHPDIRRTIINALLTINEYGVQTPQRFHAPLMIVWNLTWRCNLRCKHCYQDAGPLRGDKSSNELTLPQKLDAIRQIADSLVPTLSFSGGEPLMDPDFWQIAEEARNQGIYLSLNTNGTLLTDEAAAKLVDLGFAYVGISLDSPTSEFHDEFRGVRGAWQRTIQGIKRLAHSPVSTVLSFTVTRYNYQTLPQVFTLAQDLGVDKVMVYNFIPTGRGHYSAQLDLTPEQREEVLKMMYDYSASGGSVCSTAPQLGRVCYEFGHPEYIPLAHTGPGRAQQLAVLAQIIGGCGVGRAYLALQPDGRITPCVYMPDIEIGHITRDTIADVWARSELLKSLASHQGLKGHCGICEYAAVCGGCRARAYAYFGDLKAPDPGCIKNRDYYWAAVGSSEEFCVQKDVPSLQTGTV